MDLTTEVDPGAAGARQAVAPDAAARLCTACGFCCNGLLYQAVVLTAQEETRARPRPLPVLPGVHPARIQQPCPFHQGARCQIYAERFASCASYECELLERVMAGGESPENALGIVQEVKTILARLHALLGPEVAEATLPGAIAERLAALRSLPRSALAPADAAFLLQGGILRLLLNRHFDHRVYRTLQETTAPFAERARVDAAAAPAAATPPPG